MKITAGRIVTQEQRRFAAEESFGHVDDNALNQVAIRLVERIEGAAVTMPADWRERYGAAPASFMTWVDTRAREIDGCVV